MRPEEKGVTMKNTLITCGLLLVLVACKNETPENDLPVISVENGKVQKKFVNSASLLKKLSNISQDLTNSTLVTLNELPEAVEKTPWQLSRVSVGLGLEAEVEVTELFETEAEANIEFRFQKF